MTQRRFSRRQALQYGGRGGRVAQPGLDPGRVRRRELVPAAARCVGRLRRGAAVPRSTSRTGPCTSTRRRTPTPASGISPSLAAFEDETGIKVTYSDEINENAAVLRRAPATARSGPGHGRDIIVISERHGAHHDPGPRVGHGARPRPATELRRERGADWARDPFYDEGNRFTMAWQSGLTSIGYNTEMVNGTITKADDLMNSDITGVGKVGVLQAGRARLRDDQPGDRPVDVDPGRVAGRGRRWLTDAPRLATASATAYDQGYVDDFTAGQPLRHAGMVGRRPLLQDLGGLPVRVHRSRGRSAPLDRQHADPRATRRTRQGAYQLMDYYYDPEVAQLVTEFVLYMSPVPEVQDLIEAHGEEQDDAALIATAENPLPVARRTLESRDRVARPSAHDRRRTKSRSGTRSSTRSGKGERLSGHGRSCLAERGRRVPRPPPRRGERALARRKRAGRLRAAHARAGVYLFLAFIVPMILDRVHVPQERRAPARAATPSPGSSPTTSTDSSTYKTQFRPLGHLRQASPPRSACCSPTPWRTGSRSTPGGGSPRCFLLILVPFFVIVRHQDGDVEVHPADNGRRVLVARRTSGSCRTTSGSSRTPGAVIAGLAYNYIAVHRAPALRVARADRQAAGGGGQGPLRDRGPRRSARWSCPLSFPGVFAAVVLDVRADDGGLHQLAAPRGVPDTMMIGQIIQHEVPRPNELPGRPPRCR